MFNPFKRKTQRIPKTLSLTLSPKILAEIQKQVEKENRKNEKEVYELKDQA